MVNHTSILRAPSLLVLLSALIIVLGFGVWIQGRLARASVPEEPVAASGPPHEAGAEDEDEQNAPIHNRANMSRYEPIRCMVWPAADYLQPRGDRYRVTSRVTASSGMLSEQDLTARVRAMVRGTRFCAEQTHKPAIGVAVLEGVVMSDGQSALPEVMRCDGISESVCKCAATNLRWLRAEPMLDDTHYQVELVFSMESQ